MSESFFNILGVSPGCEAVAARKLLESQLQEPFEEEKDGEVTTLSVYSRQEEIDCDERDELCSVKIRLGRVTSITSMSLNWGTTCVLVTGDDVAKALELAGLTQLDTRFVCFHTPSLYYERTDVVISTSQGKVIDITLGVGIYYKQNEVDRMLGRSP